MSPATETPTPPLASRPVQSEPPSPPVLTVVTFRKAISELRTEFLSRLDEISSGFNEHLNEHEDRLDDHDRKIESLSEGQREIRTNVHRMGGEVNRLADSMTLISLSVERQEKNIASLYKTVHSQEKQLMGISDGTKKILELLQPKVEL